MRVAASVSSVSTVLISMLIDLSLCQLYREMKPRGRGERGLNRNCTCNKLSHGETTCPRRSRRIYVRARTDPQYAQLWWPAGLLHCAYSLWLSQLGQTDGRTDGSQHRLIPPPYGGGHNNTPYAHTLLYLDH